MSIDDAWASYRDQVVPAHAGRTQLLESRQAFFAGAAALLGLLTQDLSIEVVEQLAQELEQFTHNVANEG